MKTAINTDCSGSLEPVKQEIDIIKCTEVILLDTKSYLDNKNMLSVPIAELATLGTMVSSLLPKFRTISQTTLVNADGLYRLSNASIGDTLKIAKNGNYWGALKTLEGKSKFAQFESIGPVQISSSSVMGINPATVMMAASLLSIEDKLSYIEEMEKQILIFLEIEKESEIEADLVILTKIINNYKLNLDNDLYISSNHKLIIDIQRTARKNMNFFQKKVSEEVKEKNFLVANAMLVSKQNDFEKSLKYYRLSLYVFSMASLLEVMLSGNFKEDYIVGIKNELKKSSEDYRNLFGQCSLHIEKLNKVIVEANVLKGIGNAGKAVGKLIGNIPIIKEGNIDEFLQDKGNMLRSEVITKEKNNLHKFATLGNPRTAIFIDKMEEMIKIYNHTSEICFDNDNIYLIQD